MGKMSGFFLFVSVVFSLFAAAPAAAQEIRGKWGVGVRGGMAFLSQDVAQDTQGDSGPMVSGQLLHGVNETLSVGVDVAWESHTVKAVGVEFGEATTISAIPFAEFRADGLGALAPYLSLGLGFNFNSFDRNSFGKRAFTKFDPKDTLALRFAGGADYFVTRSLALNAEAAWKGNAGKVDVCSPFIGCGTDDWKMSAFSVLLGLRLYF